MGARPQGNPCSSAKADGKMGADKVLIYCTQIDLGFDIRLQRLIKAPRTVNHYGRMQNKQERKSRAPTKAFSARPDRGVGFRLMGLLCDEASK